MVCPGKQHSAAHARPGLSDILDSLNKEQLPALVATAVLATSHLLANWKTGLNRIY
jgi:hypothetical protein